MKTVIIWLAVVFAVLVYPEKRVLIPYGDKVFHFIIYAITCALFFTVLEKPLKGRLAATLVLSAVLASCYGLAIEIVQVFIKAKVFSLWDALANALGAVLAAGAIAAIRRRK
jgi:VanZ family protein